MGVPREGDAGLLETGWGGAQTLGSDTQGFCWTDLHTSPPGLASVSSEDTCIQPKASRVQCRIRQMAPQRVSLPDPGRGTVGLTALWSCI